MGKQTTSNQPVAEINFEELVKWLKPRPSHYHKGMAGHVLVVGGAPSYFGAPLMAAEAALRVGAGLVSVATWLENAANISIHRPEVMGHAITAAKDLLPLLEKAEVIVLGPGLGQQTWSVALWEAVISQNKPLVVDADGLNILAQKGKRKDNWVLTPHPGEAARLINKTSQQVQQARLTAANKIVQQYGGTCVLKGAGSLIVSENKLPVICLKGNPGMASAGMGDILSGVIGGLIAQRIPVFEAAQLGVYLHGWAGDLAAAASGERGLIATDLLPYIHHLSNPASI